MQGPSSSEQGTKSPSGPALQPGGLGLGQGARVDLPSVDQTGLRVPRTDHGAFGRSKEGQLGREPVGTAHVGNLPHQDEVPPLSQGASFRPVDGNSARSMAGNRTGRADISTRAWTRHGLRCEVLHDAETAAATCESPRVPQFLHGLVRGTSERAFANCRRCPGPQGEEQDQAGLQEDGLLQCPNRTDAEMGRLCRVV